MNKTQETEIMSLSETKQTEEKKQEEGDNEEDKKEWKLEKYPIEESVEKNYKDFLSQIRSLPSLKDIVCSQKSLKNPLFSH